MNINTALKKLETSVNTLRQTTPPAQMEGIDTAFDTLRQALNDSNPIPDVWFLTKTNSDWEGVDYYIFETESEAEEKMKEDYDEALSNYDPDEYNIEESISQDSAEITAYFTDECCYEECDEETTSWNIFKVSLQNRLPDAIKDRLIYVSKKNQ